ncbi:MAG: YraN family protein [Clostridiales bacterium]|nr:YraN family protein [Clostridia bacterium]MCR4564319.1 YraN family protein [Clostridiales bacterium]
MNKSDTGKLGELETARHLRRNGYNIVAANYHSRFGELDIVAEDKKNLCFVEVKTRSPGQMFSPADSVTAAKRKKIVSTANLFLSQYPTKKNIRFDIAEVIVENDAVKSINLIENAFE